MFSSGQLVNFSRSAATYREQLQRDAVVLKKLGFVWYTVEEKWEHQVLPALKTFARLPFVQSCQFDNSQKLHVDCVWESWWPAFERESSSRHR